MGMSSRPELFGFLERSFLGACLLRWAYSQYDAQHYLGSGLGGSALG